MKIVTQLASGISSELIGCHVHADVLFGPIDGVITAVDPLADDDPRRPTYTCFVTITGD